jgi:hypothetical protein
MLGPDQPLEIHDRYGRHEYAGAAFGITDEVLDERFAAYRTRFASFLG